MFLGAYMSAADLVAFGCFIGLYFLINVSLSFLLALVIVFGLLEKNTDSNTVILKAKGPIGKLFIRLIVG